MLIVMGMSGEKLLLLLFVAVLVIGPKNLPAYAQWLGRMTRKFKAEWLGHKDDIKRELGGEDVDWRQLDPRQYDPRRIVREALREPTPPRPAPPRAPAQITPAGAAAAGATAAGTVPADTVPAGAATAEATTARAATAHQASPQPTPASEAAADAQPPAAED